MVQGYNGLASPGYNGGLRKIFILMSLCIFLSEGLGVVEGGKLEN